MNRSIAVFLFVAVIAAAAVPAAAVDSITISALYSPGGSAYSIDDRGQILGRYASEAVVWDTNGRMAVIGTLGGYTSEPEDINSAGHVVGTASVTSGYNRAFLWTPKKGIEELKTLAGESSFARAVNDLGEIVGAFNMPWAQTGSSRHAFYRPPTGGVMDIGTLGGADSSAYDINESGQVVGEANISLPGVLYPPAHAYIWTRDGGMEDLGALEPDLASAARHINEAGQVGGGVTVRVTPTALRGQAAFWDIDRSLYLIGTLGGDYSFTVDMNEAGQVVGYSYTPEGTRAFLWSKESGIINLGTLGGNFSRAWAVNDLGMVAGVSRDAAGDQHAFLWTEEEGMIDLGTLGGRRSLAMGINNYGQIVGWSDPDPDEYPYSSTVPVLWEVEGFEPPVVDCDGLPDLAMELDALLAAGVLSKGRHNSLSVKLGHAAEEAAGGMVKPAVNLLGALVNELEALEKSGKLSAADAGYLIQGAEDISLCMEAY